RAGARVVAVTGRGARCGRPAPGAPRAPPLFAGTARASPVPAARLMVCDHPTAPVAPASLTTPNSFPSRAATKTSPAALGATAKAESGPLAVSIARVQIVAPVVPLSFATKASGPVVVLVTNPPASTLPLPSTPPLT